MSLTTFLTKTPDSCKWSLSPDRQWGTRHKNGSWSGMVGELMAGRVDIITSTLSLTYERSLDVDFLIPLSIMWATPFMKAGSPFGSPWTRYTEEFSLISWGVLVACIVVSILVLVFVMRSSPREAVVWGLGEASISLGGLFASQGCSQVPVNTSSRTLLLTFLMMSVLVQAHYSAFLYAKLSDLRFTIPFRTITDILDDGSYLFGVWAGTAIQGEMQVLT
ncbi:Ionotropic glutamate receptor L-glutamate and glycine-binding domain [Trinorchestia longiramus]|nr:Ionotropic glutamate receptor L-glutamate and glycine-binding domain [Trinorchestia longiramus]